MALKLLISLSKKVPGPVEFSSTQASCSIEGELASNQDPIGESARLYAQAEAAVDRQLGISVRPSPPSATQSSQPYAKSAQRRPALISAAQLRFLNQLLDKNPGALQQIVADFHVANVSELTSRDASVIIDRLKVPR